MGPNLLTRQTRQKECERVTNTTHITGINERSDQLIRVIHDILGVAHFTCPVWVVAYDRCSVYMYMYVPLYVLWKVDGIGENLQGQAGTVA